MDDSQTSGWWPLARRLPSPNQDSRPAGAAVELIVIHAISLPPCRYGGGHIEALFANRLDFTVDPYFAGIAGLRVSAHFLIDRAGKATQFVDCDARAWHAGVSAWRGRECCNDFAIGIEFEGCDTDGFTSAQYATGHELLGWLRARYPGIADDAVVGHSDIAPGRKTDPGAGFEWPRLHAGG